MRSPRRDWSDAESATLTQMWLAGQTMVAIGIALGGCGERVVRAEAERLALPRRHSRFTPRNAADRLRAAERLREAQPKGVAVNTSKAKGRSKLLDAFPPVRFIDFDRLTQCHFIEGEPAGADTLMCGRPIEAGSYCAGHRAICVMPEVS